MKREHLKNKWTFIAASLISFWVCLNSILDPPPYPIAWDDFGYYLYLPQIFIHHDLAIKNFAPVDSALKEYEPSDVFYQAHKTETGNWLIRYTPGVALINLPGFLIAHYYALHSHYDADGYTTPYVAAIFIVYYLIVIFGFWQLRNVLLDFFSDRLAAITLLLIVFGTNLLQALPKYALNTHGYLFALYAWLLHLTIKLHRSPDKRNSFWLGFCLGLIILIRPTDGLATLIPLLWPVNGKINPIQKIKTFFKSGISIWARFLVPFLILSLISPIYWKVYAGHFFYNSYQNNGEGLDLLSPHTLDFLFSFRKGWFIYTPMALLSLFGFYKFYKTCRSRFWPIFTFILVDIYIVSSWTCWWYAGSFSQRPMVQIMAVVAIPLGFLLKSIFSSSGFKKFSGILLIAVVTLFNIFQTYQFNVGIIHPSRMTRAYYFASFFDLKRDPAIQHLLLFDRDLSFTEANRREHYEKFRSWKIDAASEKHVLWNGKPVVRLNDKNLFALTIKIPYDSLTPGKYAWLKISAEIGSDSSFSQTGTQLVVCLNHKGPYGYNATSSSTLDTIPPRTWGNLSSIYLTPYPRSQKDELYVYLWHQSGAPVYASKITITSLVPKTLLQSRND